MGGIGQLFGYVFFEPTFNLLMFIYGVIHSFGWSIILMTVIVRMLMIPLFMKQLESQRQMQNVTPLIQEIQKKYKNDPQTANREIMRVYKEHNASPVSGCLPNLIQLPFIYGLFDAFNQILNGAKPAVLYSQLYPFVKPVFGSANSYYLVNLNHFMQFWGYNLAKPDPYYILPILVGLTTFVQTRMMLNVTKNQPQQANASSSQQNATQASMQMMQYVMPIMLFFFSIRFASGLSVYWTVSTLFMVIQQGLVYGTFIPYLPKSIAKFMPKPAMRVAVAANAGSNSLNVSLSNPSEPASKPSYNRFNRLNPGTVVDADTKELPDSANDSRHEAENNQNNDAAMKQNFPAASQPKTPREAKPKKPQVQFISDTSAEAQPETHSVVKPSPAAVSTMKTKTPTKPVQTHSMAKGNAAVGAKAAAKPANSAGSSHTGTSGKSAKSSTSSGKSSAGSSKNRSQSHKKK